MVVVCYFLLACLYNSGSYTVTGNFIVGRSYATIYAAGMYDRAN